MSNCYIWESSIGESWWKDILIECLGSIDELRISKGIAHWEANFVSPVEEYEENDESN